MDHAVIINHNAGSPYHGPNFRSYYAARGWVERGMKATIVCSSFSHKLSATAEVTGDQLSEDIDGIRYLWLKTRPYAGNVGRLRNFCEFALKLRRLPTIIPEPVQFVVCSSPPPLWFWSSRAFARAKRAALIFEARDLWPDVIFETTRGGRINPAAWLMRCGELSAYRHADAVVSVNPSAIKVMGPRGLAPDRFWAIPNGAVLASLEDQARDHPAIDLCEELRRDGWTLIGYSGALSRIYGLTYLAQAAARMAAERVAFVLAGDGPLGADLQRLSSTVPNLHLVGWVPKDNLVAFLRSVDICFAGLQDVRSFAFGSDSTKLYEYMNAGKPILHSHGDQDSVVVKAGCGLRVVPESVEAIVQGLRIMIGQGKEQLIAQGRAGREHLERHHGYDVLTDRWMQLFTTMSRRQHQG